MSNEINPNKPVEEETSQEVKVGESVSFDAVDAITDADIAAAKSQTAKQKQESEEAEKAAIPSEPDKKLEKVNTEEGKDKPADEKPADLPKLLRIDNQGKSVEISEEAFIEVPVDGKTEKVTLSDLKGNFAGKVAWDKRFNELNIDKQAHKKDKDDWEGQKSYVNEKVNEILAMAETDPVMAFFELCRMNNTNPDEQVKAWQKFADGAGEWNDLSPEEQQAKLAIKERDFYKNHIAKDQDRKNKAREGAELAQEADNLRQLYGLTEEEFGNSFEIAKQIYPEGHKIGAIEAIRAQKICVIGGVLQEIKHDESREDQKDLIEKTLESVMARGNEDFNQDDIKEILEAALETKSKADTKSGREVGRKFSDAEDSQPAPQKPQQEFVTFEDAFG